MMQTEVETSTFKKKQLLWFTADNTILFTEYNKQQKHSKEKK